MLTGAIVLVVGGLALASFGFLRSSLRYRYGVLPLTTLVISQSLIIYPRFL